MNNRMAELAVSRAEPVYRQIQGHVRQLILSGDYPAGTKLPPTKELAALWNTQAPTIHAALTPLVKEGLIVRRPRTGTFVQKREERLNCMGIYFCEDVWSRHSSDFLRAVHAAVKEELDRLGIRTQVWVDPRPGAEQATPWRELSQAAGRREIQGLIVPSVDWPHLRWLDKLPVPAAYLTSANVMNGVRPNHAQSAELSLHALAEQGCRSVGYIGLGDPSAPPDEDGSPSIYLEFFKRFVDLAGQLGLRMKNDWIRLPDDTTVLRHGKLQEQQERFGYQEILALLNQPERPEGLLVYPDTTARGVILGLREQQVRVPEELKLVLHTNESVPLLCPMPATLVVLSERACAQALIEQIQRQLRGERLTGPITVGLTRSTTEH